MAMAKTMLIMDDCTMMWQFVGVVLARVGYEGLETEDGATYRDSR